MNYLTFALVFILMLIYLSLQIYNVYKVVALNMEVNPLRKEGLKETDFIFRLSVLSVGVLFSIFITFFIPKTSFLYSRIAFVMIIYFLGLAVLYNLSSKNNKDLFNLTVMMLPINAIIVVVPFIILFIANYTL